MLHHAHTVEDPAQLLELTSGDAGHDHARDGNPFAGWRDTLERSLMGAAHQELHGDSVPLGDRLTQRELQSGEGGQEGSDHPLPVFVGTMDTGGNDGRVEHECGGENLTGQVEVSLVPEVLEVAADD